MDIFNRGDGGREYTMRPNISGLRNIIILAAVVIIVLLLLSLVLRVTRIEAGHVGVEINLAGRQRGFRDPGAYGLGGVFAADNADH